MKSGDVFLAKNELCVCLTRTTTAISESVLRDIPTPKARLPQERTTCKQSTTKSVGRLNGLYGDLHENHRHDGIVRLFDHQSQHEEAPHERISTMSVYSMLQYLVKAVNIVGLTTARLQTLH